ncbi:MAG TPA: radical SAM protein [Methanoculleus sp.]|nr:radical SAM protein [Methanoculleus sp.]
MRRETTKDQHPLSRYAGLHPDFAEEMAYFFQNKVYSVQIETTLACDQGCRYCYAAAASPPQQELPARSVREVLEAAARMEVRAADWLGGDPLLRDDWEALMAHAADLGLASNIWTSGLPLADPGVAERAVAASEGGFVSVHLDTLDPAIYTTLHTGRAEEKIAAILSGIETLQELGKPPEQLVNCITLTTPVTGSDVRETIRFFWEELGMRTCLTLMATAGAAGGMEHWIPSREAVREAYECRNSTGYAGSDLALGPMDVSKFYCGGVVCVTIDGEVTPCSVIREGVGNIFREPFPAIVARHKATLLATPLRVAGSRAGACSRCAWGAVCWGCRASAYYASGDPMGEDPYCWRHPAPEHEEEER